MAKTKPDTGDLRESAHKIWLAGLGALSVAGEEGEKLFKSLVGQGEEYVGRARQPVGEATDRVKDAVEDVRSRAGKTLGRLESAFDDQVAAALGRVGVPTRNEIATLTRRVEALTRQLEELKPGKKPGPRKTTKKKTASTAARKTGAKKTARKKSPGKKSTRARSRSGS